MITTIIQTTIIYWVTAIDLLLILALLFVKFDQSKHQLISLGQMIGSLLLVGISLLLAYVFHFVPEQWILGLLGLVPLFFGLKYLFIGDDDEEEVEETLEKRKNKNLLVTVTLISFASCGADNIGLFTPFFVNLDNSLLLISVLTFVVNIILLGFLGKSISKIRVLHNFLEKYSRWVIGGVYIVLGLMIIIESGTINKLLSLF